MSGPQQPVPIQASYYQPAVVYVLTPIPTPPHPTVRVGMLQPNAAGISYPPSAPPRLFNGALWSPTQSPARSSPYTRDMRPSTTTTNVLPPTTTEVSHSQQSNQHTALADFDLDSTLNDMTLRTATATIASLEDFLSGAPTHEDPVARRLIDDLRKEITDKVIRSKVMRLSKETCESMVAVFEADTQLLMTQFVRERANIVAPLVEKLGTESTFTLIRFLLDNFVHISQSMGGCIAVPRVLGHVKPSQCDVFFETALTSLPELMTHEYGNFVVKHFVNKENYCGAIIRHYLTHAEHFVTWAVTKPGSHVMEALIVNSSAADLEALCRALLLSADLVRRLAHDRYGNYCLQSAFKAMHAKVNNAQLHNDCAQIASKQARDSPFAQNIMKRIAQGHRKYKDGGDNAAATSATPTQHHTHARNGGGGGGGGGSASQPTSPLEIA
jgi:hypothetical protein